MSKRRLLDAERDTLDVRDPSRFHGFLGAYPPRLRTGNALRRLALVGGALSAFAFPLPPVANLFGIVAQGGSAVVESAELFALPALAVLGLGLGFVRGSKAALGAVRAFALAAGGAWGLSAALPRIAAAAGAPKETLFAWALVLLAGAALVARMHRPGHWTPRLALLAATSACVWLVMSPAYGPALFVPAELQAAVAARPDSVAGWLDALPSATLRALGAWHAAGLVLLAIATALAVARPDPLVDVTRARVLPVAWLVVLYLPATTLVWWVVSVMEQGVLAAPALARAKLALVVTAFALWVQFGAGAVYHQAWTALERGRSRAHGRAARIGRVGG